jgi:NADPH:quinone reductase-like Zn-dependent oxidoreductase
MHGAIGGPGTVLGLEWAGEVMALGRHVAHLRVGDRVMGSGRDAWPEQVRAVTAGRGVDLVVDMLSGATLSTAMAATAIGGRIVNVGQLAGQHAAFDFDLHALRRIQYIGVTFRTRSVAEVREVVQRMRADLWPALQAGQLMLPVAAQFPLLRVDEAFALLAAKTHFGKIVVNVA